MGAVLYCFGGGAARREGIQVNFPRGFAARDNSSRGSGRKVPRAQESLQLRRLEATLWFSNYPSPPRMTIHIWLFQLERSRYN